MSVVGPGTTSHGPDPSASPATRRSGQSGEGRGNGRPTCPARAPRRGRAAGGPRPWRSGRKRRGGKRIAILPPGSRGAVRRLRSAAGTERGARRAFRLARGIRPAPPGPFRPAVQGAVPSATPENAP